MYPYDMYRFPISPTLPGAHLFLQHVPNRMAHLTPQGPMTVPLMYINMVPNMDVNITLILCKLLAMRAVQGLNFLRKTVKAL